MRHLFLFIAFSIGVGSTAAQGQDPIVLRQMGSFHVGGRLIEITGQPIKEVVFTPGGVPARMDPNGKYQVEQMYVQYFLPQHRKGKMPLLLWHGGGLTGVTFETKPDGGEGWLNFFIRQDWDTYISDAVERGRAGWTNTFKGDPVFLPFGDPWERFRIGRPGSWNNEKDKRTTYPSAQFPTAAYEQFMKQAVPRWLTTDDQIVAAYVELVDKVCPCVVTASLALLGSKYWRRDPKRSGAWLRSSPHLGATPTRSHPSRTRRSLSSMATTRRTIRAGRKSARAASVTGPSSSSLAAMSMWSIFPSAG